MEAAGRSSGVALSRRVLDACAAHFDLMLAWNRTHNLTRITDPAAAARRHYLDCLVPLLAWDAPASFLDLGSGAGFPGILAALAWPQAAAALAEVAHKRQSFLRLACANLEVRALVEADGRAERVLSRATLPPGARRPLADRAFRAVAVWGHPADLPVWENEVAGWGKPWRARLARYEIDGLEPRALLIAER